MFFVDFGTVIYTVASLKDKHFDPDSHDSEPNPDTLLKTSQKKKFIELEC